MFCVNLPRFYINHFFTIPVVSGNNNQRLGQHIAFVGEVSKHEQTKVISKIDAATGKYEGYFIENGKLIGAILINNREKRPSIIEKIKLGEPLQDKNDLLR